MLSPEDELDTLDEELGRARRLLVSVERAPSEGRWCGGKTEWLDAVANQRQRVRVLERERAGLLADLVAAAEGFVS